MKSCILWRHQGELVWLISPGIACLSLELTFQQNQHRQEQTGNDQELIVSSWWAQRLFLGCRSCLCANLSMDCWSDVMTIPLENRNGKAWTLRGILRLAGNHDGHWKDISEDIVCKGWWWILQEIKIVIAAGKWRKTQELRWRLKREKCSFAQGTRESFHQMSWAQAREGKVLSTSWISHLMHEHVIKRSLV